tara:strand:- start:1129 stop:1323 length:195 start_codon:yes stop_codon:yes gene_type:complete
MKAVKKSSTGDPLTEEQKRAVRYKIKELKGEIGVVNRNTTMTDKAQAAEIKILQHRISELQAKL